MSAPMIIVLLYVSI